ncbi:MAG: hypothetical protein Q9216_003728 [Gyalolechia sp. 2 TL-2023]
MAPFESSNDKGVTGAAKFATSTLGNTVGGLGRTVGGVVGAGGRGLGQTVTAATGSSGKPVGDALENLGNGVESGAQNVSKGVEDAGNIAHLTASLSTPKSNSLMYWGGVLALLGWAATAVAQGNLGGDQSASCSASQNFVYVGCYDNGQNGGNANFPFRLITNAGDSKSYPGFTSQDQLTRDLYYHIPSPQPVDLPLAASDPTMEATQAVPCRPINATPHVLETPRKLAVATAP